MKEEIAKKLVQKSTVKTSEDFTNNLMLKIEAEASSKLHLKSVRSQYLKTILMVATISITTFFTLLFFDFSPIIKLMNFEFTIDRNPFYIFLLLFLLIGVNQILKLQHLLNLRKSL